MEETKEEIQLRILGYQQQMKQVEDFLASDPTNAQFLTLKEDLQKVIDLTTDLLSLKDTPSSSSFVAAGERPGDDNSDDGDGDDDDDGEDEEESTQANLAPRPPVPTGVIGIGEIVEVHGGDRPYAGVVTAIQSDGSYRVKYFEYEAEVNLPASSIVRIAPGPLTAGDVTPGFRGQCKYSADQKYYQIVVTASTPHGFMVKYLEYGNVEEVPVEYLRPMPQKKAHDGKKLMSISESLKIKPTDTEEVWIRYCRLVDDYNVELESI